MNKYTLIILAILLSYSSVEAQHFRGNKFGFRGRDRIEQLEKLKLIEVLDLDEETSIRFFTRRKDHMENQRELAGNREQVFKEIEGLLKDGNSESKIKSKMTEIFEIEGQMVEERINFFNSLNDILSLEKIAKVLAFEGRFKREIWKSLMQKPGNLPPNE